jgi:hypothetical protein
MNMYWIQILLCTDLWSNTHYIKSNIYDKLLYRFWPLFSTWFHTNLFKVYLNYFWKKRHIQRELFDGYLIMYFSQKNILFFLIYFFVKPSFWKSKNTNRLHFWRGLRISISFWLNRKKEVVMAKRRQIAIKLIGSYMRIYMYFIEQWDYIIKNIWKIIFKY